MIEPLGGFLLVHVSTPLETCEATGPEGAIREGTRRAR